MNRFKFLHVAKLPNKLWPSNLVYLDPTVPFKSAFLKKTTLFRMNFIQHKFKALPDKYFQYWSIFTDSFYSQEKAFRKQKYLRKYFMSCQENLILNNRNFYGSFCLGPFKSGQSITVANALRRTLLSELPGIAIIAVEIEGVTHEYSNISGIKDTVLDILLNLKEIVFKSNYIFNVEDGEGFLQVRGPGIVRACDIKLPSYLLCVDPEQYIATLCEDGFLNMKLYISSGENSSMKNSVLDQRSADQTKLQSDPTLPDWMNLKNKLYLDPVFTPVVKINYIIEQNPQDFSSQMIVLEIWTNGSLHPRKALYDALKKLINIFCSLKKIKMLESSLKSNKTYRKLQMKLEKTKKTLPNSKILKDFPTSKNSLDNSKLLNVSIKSSSSKKKVLNLIPDVSSNLNFSTERVFQKFKKNYNYSVSTKIFTDGQNKDIAVLNLSLRAYSSLKNANIETIEDLLKYSPTELFKIKNLGQHALVEIQKKLIQKGYLHKATV